MSEQAKHASYHGVEGSDMVAVLKSAEQAGAITLNLGPKYQQGELESVDITSECTAFRCGGESIKDAMLGREEGIIYCAGCRGTQPSRVRDYSQPPTRVFNMWVQAT